MTLLNLDKKFSKGKNSPKGTRFILLYFASISKFEFKTTKPWSKKELLSEEFISLGFYISDHPLNNYKAIKENLYKR